MTDAPMIEVRKAWHVIYAALLLGLLVGWGIGWNLGYSEGKLSAYQEKQK